MVTEVTKRDGRVVEFLPTKIYEAVMKAFKDVDKFNMNDENIKNNKQYSDDSMLAYEISKSISELHPEQYIQMSVEDIQDEVEKRLMKSDRPDVAKAYIIYRNERTKQREKDSRLVKAIMVRANAEVDDRSNANVDEKSFSGREKEASADIGKLAALDYGGLPEDVAQAHKNMLIYGHDLEKAVYGVHNCLNFPFPKIFKTGFSTRNGDVRPPRSFSSATQQYAVSFQCQSQV